MEAHDLFRDGERADVTLEAELAAALEAVRHGAPPPEFAPWALRIFAHQFERNPPYRAFCARRGVSPAGVARWEDVPPVPTAAFRRVDLACAPAETVFRTSGTTRADERGRHLVPHLPLPRLGARDLRALRPPGPLPARVPLPRPLARAAADSSLVRMCAWVGEALAASIEWMAGAEGSTRNACSTASPRRRRTAMLCSSSA
jgi:hypothetical protein